MIYGLPKVLTKMQTKSIPYTFNRGGYYYFSRAECHLLHLANSELLRKARDEIIDKTLDVSTAAMASMKL